MFVRAQGLQNFKKTYDVKHFEAVYVFNIDIVALQFITK